jgi:hypothetical protein
MRKYNKMTKLQKTKTSIKKIKTKLKIKKIRTTVFFLKREDKCVFYLYVMREKRRRKNKQHW